MSFFDKILQSIGIKPKTATTPQNDKLRYNPNKKYKKGLVHQIKPIPPLKVELETHKLESAIIYAESRTSTNRLYLLEIYKQVARDSEVFCNTRNLTNKILASDFNIYKNGVIDEQLKKLLSRAWFWDYQRYWIEHIWYGHSLIEFDRKTMVDENGIKEFHKIYLIDRRHVKPWEGIVVVNPFDTTGIDYRNTMFKNSLIEVGNDWDLGILHIAARDVIYKHYSMSDWSRHSEKFGMPISILQTDTERKEELDTKENMLSNLGAAGYALLDKNDVMTLLESAKTDAFKIYLERIKYSDSAIAKIISGQTATTQEKSFVGAAEVHERILNTYSIALLMQLEQHINETLLPFLIRNGYPLVDCTFKFLDIERLRTATKTEDVKTDPEKKNLRLTLSSFFGGCCSHHHQDKDIQILTGVNIQRLIEAAVRNIYNEKLQTGTLDKELWRYNVEQLIDALEKGFSKKITRIDYNDQDFAMMQQLKRNIYVYAAFKNYHNIKDMVDALDDGNGNIRPFDEFKQKAFAIGQTYNENYLKTEYNTAIGQAQMAQKWNNILSQKDALPILRYDTVDDDRVRPEHQELEGVTLPIEHPFWEKYLPPNGFNCRCNVRQLVDAPIKQPPKTVNVDDAFANNAGASGQLYSNDHPYFDNVSKKQKDAILQTARTFILEDDTAFKKSLKAVRLKKNTPNISDIDKAAIHLYTTKEAQKINLKLRVERLSDAAWAAAEQISLALSQLPKYKGNTYRVSGLNQELFDKLKDAMENKTGFTEKGFLSTSSSIDFALSLFDYTGQSRKAIMQIESKNGRSISSLSKKPKQDEILFDKNTTFTVVDIIEIASGIFLVKLKER